MEALINTLSQKIVPPSQIEKELLQIWESLIKEKKIRANLFNLIVVIPFNHQYDRIREIVQNLIQKFPCRILFMTIDLRSEKSYYKSAVSVVFPDEKDPTIACDYIDIVLAGEDIEKIPYLALPHLLPDLPVHLFWPQNEKEYLLVLQELQSFVNRIIFDSKSFDTIYTFASFVLEQKKTFPNVDIADLQWIQLEGYKHCIAAEFHSKARLESLKKLSRVSIYYDSNQNASKDQIQSVYLQGWLALSMGLTYVKTVNEGKALHFLYQPDIVFELTGQPAGINLGSIMKVIIQTKEKEVFSFSRNLEKPQSVKVEIESPIQCELPYYYSMERSESNLSNEMMNKKSSSHFLKTLTYLSKQV